MASLLVTPIRCRVFVKYCQISGNRRRSPLSWSMQMQRHLGQICVNKNQTYIYRCIRSSRGNIFHFKTVYFILIKFCFFVYNNDYLHLVTLLQFLSQFLTTFFIVFKFLSWFLIFVLVFNFCLGFKLFS